LIAIDLNLGPEPHWPDLDLTKVIHLGNDAPPIKIASLPGGMGSGRASICLRIDLPDGRTVLAETSLRLLCMAARGFAAKYPEEMRPDCVPVDPY
jgi:hypothetical protein